MCDRIFKIFNQFHTIFYKWDTTNCENCLILTISHISYRVTALPCVCSCAVHWKRIVHIGVIPRIATFKLRQVCWEKQADIRMRSYTACDSLLRASLIQVVNMLTYCCWLSTTVLPHDCFNKLWEVCNGQAATSLVITDLFHATWWNWHVDKLYQAGKIEVFSYILYLSVWLDQFHHTHEELDIWCTFHKTYRVV